MGKQQLSATGNERRDVGTRVKLFAELADAMSIGAGVFGFDRGVVINFASALGMSEVLIVGDDELEKGEALLRNMATKEQATVSLAGIVDDITAIVRKESNRA